MPGLACDLSKEEDCVKLVKACENTLGNIDTLICNVGSGKSVQAGDESLSEWKRVFDINFFSTVNTVNALLKKFKIKKYFNHMYFINMCMVIDSWSANNILCSKVCIKRLYKYILKVSHN